MGNVHIGNMDIEPFEGGYHLTLDDAAMAELCSMLGYASAHARKESERLPEMKERKAKINAFLLALTEAQNRKRRNPSEENLP